MCIPSVIPVSAVRLSLCIFSLCIGYIYIYIYTHTRAHAHIIITRHMPLLYIIMSTHNTHAWNRHEALSALSAGSVWRLYSFVAVVVCLSLCVCDIQTLIDAQGLKHTRIDVCLWFTQGGCRSSAPADAKERYQDASTSAHETWSELHHWCLLLHTKYWSDFVQCASTLIKMLV